MDDLPYDDDAMPHNTRSVAEVPLRERIVVRAGTDDPELHERARTLARRLGLPLAKEGQPGVSLALVVAHERLELRDVTDRRGCAVFADFAAGGTGHRLRRGGLAGQMIARAIGYNGSALKVIDATAGLGADTVLLACLGCTVTAVERSAVIAALLADGLARAARDARLTEAVTQRIRLIEGDARAVLANLSESERPDVTYLDPMFPHRAKSALSRKEMRMCRLVAGDDPDAPELLETALAATRRRVVVKRWLRAAPIAGRPAYSYKGRAIRYDVYLPRLSDP